MESVLDRDHQAVQDYRAARRDVSQRLVELADRRTDLAAQLVQAKHYDKAVRADVKDARVQLMAFEAGSQIFVTGMVFPVGDPHQFTDTFLAPRSGGRQHQGHRPHAHPMLRSSCHAQRPPSAAIMPLEPDSVRDLALDLLE